jgi:hypothetical protein
LEARERALERCEDLARRVRAAQNTLWLALAVCWATSAALVWTEGAVRAFYAAATIGGPR